jgi:hypothetical protein
MDQLRLIDIKSRLHLNLKAGVSMQFAKAARQSIRRLPFSNAIPRRFPRPFPLRRQRSHAIDWTIGMGSAPGRAAKPVNIK